MSNRLRYSALVLCLILIALPVTFIQAATGENVRWEVGCSAFVNRGGVLAFDRDNTGRGQEVIRIRAVDGAGKVIFSEDLSGDVGTSLTIPVGQSFAWESAPEFNPLTVRVTSVLGNSQAVQLLAVFTGDCDSLPDFIVDEAEAEAAEPTATAVPVRTLPTPSGVTAPSVDPNASAPRPTTDPDDLVGLPGYAIVNTDNLFVRSGPAVTYTPVAIVDGGTALIVLGRSEEDLPDNSDDLWWYIEVGGIRGWVNSALLFLRGDLSGIPVADVQGETIQPVVYVGFDSTALLSSPQSGAQAICTLDGDRFYTVIARDSVTENWYYVDAVCENGVARQGWLPLEGVIFRNEAKIIIPIYGE
jgi:uncharacterized protein YgiM (DUF1202 family)